MSFHAIVLGSGADALAAAHFIARGGRQVLVVEERPGPARELGWVPSQVVGELALRLTLDAPDPWASALLPDGGRLELWRDMGRSVESIRRLSPADAARWPEFSRRMAALANILGELYLEAPSDPRNLRVALRVRRLGREGMLDLMRLLPMSVAELLDDWFQSDALKGVLGAMGVLNLQQGPRSGGTAFRLLHHHVGSPAGVFRPPRSNIGAVLRERPGVHFKPAGVEKIRVKDARVQGIVLKGGEEIAAPIVVSGIDPRRTLLELADPVWLDPELVRAVGHIRCRGVAARLSFQARLPSNVVVAPSLDYLEHAYDHIKYDRVSRAPYLETAATPSGVDVHFQYVPYEAYEDLASTARRLLPGLGDAEASVLAPADLEREEGWPRGQPHHAELALDQALWMRPHPELAQYKTPIQGLWLCGPASHPGGGIPGAAGYNCARAVLAQHR